MHLFFSIPKGLLVIGHRLAVKAAVRAHSNTGKPPLGAVILYADISQIVHGQAVGQPYTLVSDGQIVQMVVATECAPGAAHLLQGVKHIVRVKTGEQAALFADAAVVHLHFTGVFIAVFFKSGQYT